MKTETKHKRGFFGRVWQVSFWLFQIAMIWAIFINVDAVTTVATECATSVGDIQYTQEEIALLGADYIQSLEVLSEAACGAGAAIGGGLVAIMGWFVWFLGTIIIGIFMFATRGKLITTTIKD